MRFAAALVVHYCFHHFCWAASNDCRRSLRCYWCAWQPHRPRLGQQGVSALPTLCTAYLRLRHLFGTLLTCKTIGRKRGKMKNTHLACLSSPCTPRTDSNQTRHPRLEIRDPIFDQHRSQCNARLEKSFASGQLPGHRAVHSRP